MSLATYIEDKMRPRPVIVLLFVIAMAFQPVLIHFITMSNCCSKSGSCGKNHLVVSPLDLNTDKKDANLSIANQQCNACCLICCRCFLVTDILIFNLWYKDPQTYFSHYQMSGSGFLTDNWHPPELC